MFANFSIKCKLFAVVFDILLLNEFKVLVNENIAK